MKLYELIKLSQEDYDTYDVVYDAEVTVCYIEESAENDTYDRFCIELAKKVKVEKINGDALIVNWTKLIMNNMEKFKKFSREYWAFDYENDIDEFIYQWINEFHAYLAGYVSEDFYNILVEFVKSLKI